MRATRQQGVLEVVCCGTKPSPRVRARAPPIPHLLRGGYGAFQGGRRYHGRFGTPEEEKGEGAGGRGGATAGESVLATPLWDILLRKASVARVDRRLRRYYLIVRLLPNVFALACRSLGSIWYDTGSPQDGKTPFSWLHPCRLVTDSRRYLIVGASTATPLHSSIYFFSKQPCFND